jgi:hypothetical protein
MKYLIVPVLALAGLLAACEKPGSLGAQPGWKPIYASTAEYKTIRSGLARPIENGGKFAWFAGRIFMVEKGLGVHIISYADPANPVKERFIEVPGCYEVTLKNGYLIVNNGPDLVSLDISQPAAVTIASRLDNFFQSIQEANSAPPDAQSGDYYECPDFGQGVILRWERQTIQNPECRFIR